MSFSTGKGAYFAFDDPSGSLYDHSGFTTNVEHGFDVNTHETTTFGQNRVTRITGLKDKKISVSFNWDPTLDRRLAPQVGQVATFSFGPNGSGSGSVRYTGEALCTGFSLSDPVDDVITASAEFESDGTVTRDTF
jgi:hypothetical protein